MLMPREVSRSSFDAIAVGMMYVGSELPAKPIFVYLGRVSAGTSRSEEHTSELQSLMRISYAVFCLKKNNNYSSRTKDDILNMLSETQASTQYDSNNNYLPVLNIL